MALTKSEKKIEINPIDENRNDARDLTGLLKQLTSESSTERRWAARDLGQYPEAAEALLDSLLLETELPVCEAIFDALGQIKGEVVVSGLIPVLRSEDAALRNGAIEILQMMPEIVALHIIELLNDQDSDVRIFAIDILQVLAHPQTPEWLLSVLKDETHVNVIATAVDRLSEVGTPEMVDELEAIKVRFPAEPYLLFAVDTAIKRIREV